MIREPTAIELISASVDPILSSVSSCIGSNVRVNASLLPSKNVNLRIGNFVC